MQVVLQRVFRRAATTLGGALRHHWPCFGQNEPAEANPLVHIALALAKEGFHVYAQCPLEAEGYPRVDLCALTQRHGLLIEAKRLHAGQGAAWMVNDWSRLGRLQLRVTTAPVPQPKTIYRAMVATTQSTAIRDWWSRRGQPRTPIRSRGRSEIGWRELGRVLKRSTQVESLPLEGEGHSFLYAFGPRPRLLFAG